MIPVYVRDAARTEHHFLGYFQPDALDELVATIPRWGIYTDRRDSADAFGQFFALDGRAGFEIVVHEEEA